MTKSRTRHFWRLQAAVALFALLSVLSTASARAIHRCATLSHCCVEASTSEAGGIFLDGCPPLQGRHGLLCRALAATPAGAINGAFDPNPPAAAAFSVTKCDAPLLAVSPPTHLRVALFRLPRFIVFGNFRS